jgi:formylglycine-generating enzyme required for sulfatase activity
MARNPSAPKPLAHSTRTRTGKWGWAAPLGVVGAGILALVLIGNTPTADDLRIEPPGPAPAGMVWVPGGVFHMGSDDPNDRLFSDARPIHEVAVTGFWMDARELTNAEFARFVEATGYVTVAEQAPDWEEMKKQVPPGTPKPPADQLVPGSLVFTPPDGPVPLDNPGNWWRWTPGASWKQPEGPGSDLNGRENHPVVHVCWDDAAAYCAWAGKRLPTEAEWEYAARGGLKGQTYVWGAEPPEAGGKSRCNKWQGEFPHKNSAADGYPGTAPVGSFAPNGYGLSDMAGNVWEWCADWYRPDYYRSSPRKDPKGPDSSFDPAEAVSSMPKRVQRGGSFLCSDAFCSRYKPYGRGKGDVRSAASHIGFRCAQSPE